MPGEISLAHHGILCLSADATSSRSCANRSKMASHEDDFANTLNLNVLAVLAAQVMTAKDSNRARRGMSRPCGNDRSVEP
jgi:hypothetical protein